MVLMKHGGGCAFLFSMFAPAVFTAPATADTVELDNGDRITGAVEKLTDGKLTVDTAYAGPIDIEWDVVRHLKSEGSFDIRAANGRIYTGTIERSADKLSIEGAEDAQEIDILDISGFIAIAEDEKSKPTFRQNLKIEFDLGYNLTRGNSLLTQSALGANVQYADSKQQLSSMLTSIRSSQGNVPTTSRHAWDVRYDRFVNERFFAYGLGGLEDNEMLLLDLRTKLGGGIGLQFIKDAKTTVSLLGGANYARENYLPDEAGMRVSVDRGEGTAGFEIKLVRFNGIEFASRLFLFPNLADAGRYRFEYDGEVRVPVFKNCSYELRFYDRYDSRSAVAANKNAYGFISALAYTF